MSNNFDKKSGSRFFNEGLFQIVFARMSKVVEAGQVKHDSQFHNKNNITKNCILRSVYSQVAFVIYNLNCQQFDLDYCRSKRDHLTFVVRFQNIFCNAEAQSICFVVKLRSTAAAVKAHHSSASVPQSLFLFSSLSVFLSRLLCLCRVFLHVCRACTCSTLFAKLPRCRAASAILQT